jgi:hypothetical protein
MFKKNGLHDLGEGCHYVDGTTAIVGDSRHCHLFPFRLLEPQVLSGSLVFNRSPTAGAELDTEAH